jgi:outer membrane receptor protein involved in Fe transport
MFRSRVPFLLLLCLMNVSAFGQQLPRVYEHIEVTATRIPDEVSRIPAAIEVFDGDELRARGATDLRGALAQAIGVEIAPGGDAGPASSVPAFRGLKEFDAFLLVVDGVPWGGAFNPALTSLDLNDIDRIEVLRGPAPVMYGATSFVGVIQVVHKSSTDVDKTLSMRVGSYRSGAASFSSGIPLGRSWTSRVTLDAERQGFRDNRTSFERGHALWRVERKTPGPHRSWFNVDINWLNQHPASARPGEGATLSPLVPVDANHHPSGAFLNDHRFTAMGGIDWTVGGAAWSTTASFSHSNQDIFRGYLMDLSSASGNAQGIREKIDASDVYIDSHLAWKLAQVTLLAGGDFLHGEGKANGAGFTYTVPLDGAGAPSVQAPNLLPVQIEDRRDFVGPYVSLEWEPVERLRIDAGLRMNITVEEREGEEETAKPVEENNRQTNKRAGGSVGAVLTAWHNAVDALRLFINYRDTFKPAVFDFGIVESESDTGESLLKPETSRSYEGGVKTRLVNGRIDWEASIFRTDFRNLVIAATVNGLPSLTNGGTQRFSGFETGTSFFLRNDLTARATYSFHDAVFRDFVQVFDGVSTQLAGKQLEMSPHHLANIGLLYAPVQGFLGGIETTVTGTRFLNKRNTANAEAFATLGLSGGYRQAHWELRIDGRDLTNRRDPVSESELGDSQFYLMTPRRMEVNLSWRF